MTILQQIAPVSCTLLPPFPLLPPPRAFFEQKNRLALPAPKIAGYLPAPRVLPSALMAKGPGVEGKRVVEAEIVNPLILIDIRKDPKGFWAEFERIHGPDKTIEEMDAEIEARHPGYLAWVERMKATKATKATKAREAVRS